MSQKKIRPLPPSIVRQLPDSQYCVTPLLNCLWALSAAKLSNALPEFVPADTISELLLRANVHLNSVSAHRALARAGDAVARQGQGQGTEYRIVGISVRLLEDKAGRKGPLTLYVTGKAPWSDRRFVVKEAMKKAAGDVQI